MDFVEKVVEKFSSGGRQEEVYEERSYYNNNNSGPPPPPGPPLPAPWVARWSEAEQRWYYINEVNGDRSWERPGYGPPAGGYGLPGGYGGGYGGGYNEGYGAPGGYREVVQERTYYEDQPQKKDHSMLYGAAGLAAGAAGGALLMHEGEKLHEDWDEEKYKIEDRVENFPENAAEWTGDKVGEAEYDIDRAKYEVENLPEEAAEWTGDKVGGIERFNDRIESAYDEGEYEGRSGW